MPRPDRSTKRATNHLQDVVVWECFPSVSAQAEALLNFLGVLPEGISVSDTPRSSEHGSDHAQGGRL